MRSLVIKGPHTIEWAEICEPISPRQDEVQIKIKAAGICGTDIHILHGKHGAVTYPRIPGHELVGEVTAVGENITHVKCGDHVAIDPVVSCGKCPMCQSGRHNICHEVKCLGVQTEGGFTELINIKGDKVYPFSPDVPWDIAALVEPFSIAAQIAERLRINRQDKVLIVGGGTIGLAVLQVVQGVYRAEAIIADISNNKLNLAKEMGAVHVINSTEIDPVHKSGQIWKNTGPTVIIEAVGNSGLLNNLIKDAPPGCRIGVIGFMNEPINISPVEITKRELEIIGSRMNRNKFKDVLEWFKDQKVKADKLITHKYSFEDAAKGFAIINDKPDEVCKVILEF